MRLRVPIHLLTYCDSYLDSLEDKYYSLKCTNEVTSYCDNLIRYF